METFVDPSPENFAHFKSLDRDTPILMLNQLLFKAVAAYPEGHMLADKPMSGAEAYALYGETSGSIFQRVGGTIVWRGHFQGVVIGPNDEKWDTVFIARYPNAHAFLEMVTDPDYQLAVVNRQAAVQTSRLIRFAEHKSTGDVFSG